MNAHIHFFKSLFCQNEVKYQFNQTKIKETLDEKRRETPAVIFTINLLKYSKNKSLLSFVVGSGLLLTLWISGLNW